MTPEQLRVLIEALQSRGDGQMGGGGRKRRVIVEKDFRSVDKFDGTEKN